MVPMTILQQDAVTEWLNVGIGLAASSLSEMLQEEIELTVPMLDFTTCDKIAGFINSETDGKVAAVEQEFSGPIWGKAMLLFPGSRSLELARSLLKNSVSLDMLTELEQETLTEIGNIILNACLASFADSIGEEIRSELPIYHQGSGEQILESTGESGSNDIIMFIRIDFTLRDTDIKGYVVFTLNIDSMEALRKATDQFIGNI